MPFALSYMAHKLVDEFSAVWNVVNAEYSYFLAARWVHTLLTDKVFAWLDANAIKRMSKLDLHRTASGPGGQAMLATFHRMHKATEVFPWTIVVKDVIRRDTQTRVARQVHVHLDSLAEYGFMLNHPFRGFASVPVGGGGSDDDGDTPAAAAQGNAVLSAKGRGRPVGLRVGLIRLAVGRFRRCARRALQQRPADMRVRRRRTFGLRRRRFRRRWPCLATGRVVVWTGSACLVASGRPLWLRRGIARRRRCTGRNVTPMAMSLRTPCRCWLGP